MGNTQKPEFPYGIIWVRDGKLQRVSKHRRGFCKVDAVLRNIRKLFVRIPLEFHHNSNLIGLTGREISGILRGESEDLLSRFEHGTKPRSDVSFIEMIGRAARGQIIEI